MEEMSVDVVQRRCKVVKEDIDVLTATLNTTTQSLQHIKGEWEWVVQCEWEWAVGVGKGWEAGGWEMWCG